MSRAGRAFLRNRAALAGMLILGLVALSAVAAPLAPY
ncbi:MAG: hypothetical protein ACHQ1G_09310, partial [Planctomycetota bacterium]